MLASILVKCPHCGSVEIVKAGFTNQKKQRYHCRKEKCAHKFLLDYKNKGHTSDVKKKIITMALNGSGIRDTVGVFGISTWLVMNEIKRSLRFKKSKFVKNYQEK